MLGKIAVTACFASAALAKAIPALLPRAASLPTLDLFYDQPDNISDYTTGQIIRYRDTPGPIGAAQQYTTLNIKDSYQILFRTQDALGNPTAVMTTVLVPYNAQYDKLLSYQAAYDSSDPNCSPSYTLQQSSNNTSYDPLLIATALNEGWVVSTTDFEGLQAHFVAGLTAGYSTIDSVRATLSSEAITGVLSNATLGLWGYSGGALACEWALEVQPTYAPELNFVGAALGGLTPNITNVIDLVNGTQFVSLIFSGVNGLTSAYPNFTDYINSILIPEKVDLFHAVNFECTNDTNAKNEVANMDLFEFFTTGYEALDEDVPMSVIKWGATMGFRATPQAPVFAYKAIADEVSSISYTDALVAKYCDQGARIQYVRNTVGEHVSEAILGAGQAWGYMIDRMNGVEAPPGCSTSNVTITGTDDQSFEGISASIVGGLKGVLELPLGPGSFQGM